MPREGARRVLCGCRGCTEGAKRVHERVHERVEEGAEGAEGAEGFFAERECRARLGLWLRRSLARRHRAVLHVVIVHQKACHSKYSYSKLVEGRRTPTTWRRWTVL